MDNITSRGMKLILIGGTGRSGTNITKKILSVHSKVGTLPFEHRITIDPNGIIDFYNTVKFSWSPFLCHQKLNDLIDFLSKLGSRKYFNYWAGKIIKQINPSGKCLTTTSYHGWELQKWFPNYFQHINTLKKDLIDFKYNAAWPGEKAFLRKNEMNFVTPDILRIQQCLRTFFINLITDFLTENKKDIFVEDNTWNLLYADSYSEILPDVKFIHVVRDPRDVVSSLIKQRWAPNRLEYCLTYYINIIEKIIGKSKMLRDSNLLLLRLEDLVTKKKENMELLSDFCELELESKMLEVDLSKANIGRWKTEFNDEEKSKMDSLLKKYVNLFGYN